MPKTKPPQNPGERVFEVRTIDRSNRSSPDRRVGIKLSNLNNIRALKEAIGEQIPVPKNSEIWISRLGDNRKMVGPVRTLVMLLNLINPHDVIVVRDTAPELEEQDKPNPDQQFISRLKTFTEKHQCTVIVTVEGTRAVCGEHIDTSLPVPQEVTDAVHAAAVAGTQDHTFQEEGKGRRFGERNGMFNNWTGNISLVDLLLTRLPILLTILKIVYGNDFHIAMDRFWYRNANENKDRSKKGQKELERNLHVDVPEWKKCDGEEVPPVTTVHVPKGFVGIIVLSQSAPHSIPQGGHSKGVYLAALTDQRWAPYKREVDKLWNSLFVLDKNQQLDQKKAVYVWKEAVKAFRETPFDFNLIIVLSIVFGLHPGIYPSGKIIRDPPTYSGAYKYYTAMCPNPAKMTVDPKEALDKIENPLVKHLAAKVHHALPQHKWVVDPSSISNGTWLKVLDVAPTRKRPASEMSL